MSNRFFPSYDTYKITSRFGMRTLKGVTKLHKGIDLVAKTDSGGSATDYITAHTGGTVIGSGYDSSAGNYIKIQTAPGVVMVYYHMASPSKYSKGDTVKTRQHIGTMGATGKVTGAHLHFGIQVNGEWVDPEPYLDCDYPELEDKPEDSNSSFVPCLLPVLSRGDKGEAVRAMQALLALRGYPCGVHGTDGSFGPDTESVLTTYQSEHSLPISGICDSDCWHVLINNAGGETDA
ncbi:MAG: peptidoglycan DD-metalloendopeptidase family protein [Oscillospiraceae bacterium]|nr:peptidoglycan DD-metalloendopeptidase family protein [Oscillospiraceae bacterium]